MLQQLKSLDVDRVQLEDFIALQVFGKSLRAGYEDLDLEPPSWLTDKLRVLRRTIDLKLDDQRAKDIRETELELDRLKSPSDRRSELQAKLKKLQKLQPVEA